MATFKVGQRVRVVRSQYGFEGKEGTVISEYVQWTDAFTGIKHWGHRVSVDGVGDRAPNGLQMFAQDGWIEPLVKPDPAADAFMSRIKRLGREPITDKVTERVK